MQDSRFGILKAETIFIAAALRILPELSVFCRSNPLISSNRFSFKGTLDLSIGFESLPPSHRICKKFWNASSRRVCPKMADSDFNRAFQSSVLIRNQTSKQPRSGSPVLERLMSMTFHRRRAVRYRNSLKRPAMRKTMGRGFKGLASKRGISVEYDARLFIAIGCGRLGAAEVNRVLVARNDGVDRRMLPRSQTFEAKLLFVIRESGRDVRSEELRRNLTDHEPSLVQIMPGQSLSCTSRKRILRTGDVAESIETFFNERLALLV
ncbi:MAG: hypothetical protein ACR2JB_15850 [Bryobacteraceae bacterium]